MAEPPEGEWASNPEFVSKWDVARDDDGEPITITPAQLGAIWHAIRVVEDVRVQHGVDSMWRNPRADIYKSRLLGRLLLDGRPPTRTKPPLEMGGPNWHGLPGGDPFAPDECPRCFASKSGPAGNVGHRNVGIGTGMEKWEPIPCPEQSHTDAEDENPLGSDDPIGGS